MKRTIFCVLVVLVVLLFAQTGFAKIYSKIKGRVIDEETKQGIQNVHVTLYFCLHDNPKELYIKTDKNGYFSFSNVDSGKYILNYIPEFPYVAVPTTYNLETDRERAFFLKEGEVKHVEQRMKKGGKIVLNNTSTNADLSKYTIQNFYVDMIKDNVFSTGIRRLGKRDELWGLEEGEYIICQSLRKRDKYLTGNDVDFAGLIRFCSLEKLETKIVDFNYDSNARLEFNTKDQNGNKPGYINLNLYKKVNVSGKLIYYKVWNHTYLDQSYIRPNPLNPIYVESGNYIISTT